MEPGAQGHIKKCLIYKFYQNRLALMSIRLQLSHQLNRQNVAMFVVLRVEETV